MARIASNLKSSDLFFLGCLIKLLVVVFSQILFFAQSNALNNLEGSNFLLFLIHLWGSSLNYFNLDIFITLGEVVSGFFADMVILFCLLRISTKKIKKVFYFYWLSPVIIVQNYFLLGSEVFSIAFFVLSLTFLNENKLSLCGALLAIALILNLALVPLVVFVFIFIWQQKRIRDMFPTFFMMFFVTLSALLLLFQFLPLYFTLNGYNSLQGITNLIYAPNLHFSIMPLVLIYFVSIYLVWRLRRSNFESLTTTLGVVCIAFLIFSGDVDFWFIGALPFIILYATKTTKTGQNILIGIQFFVALYFLFDKGLVNNDFLSLFAISLRSINIDFSFFATLIASVLLILIMRMIGEGIVFSNYYRITRKSLVIGVAGDSGSGKDTLSRAIAGLFGVNSVSTIYGDAYHKWDRNAPMWRTVTHLNPLANDLSQLTKDVVAVTSGETLYKRHYDHREGRFTYPIKVKSNDVVLVTGLHALFESQLRERLDVKIFLETDTALRLHWKLNRDTAARRQYKEKLLNIEIERENDRLLYILPQEKHANLVFRLMPINPRHLNVNPGLKNPSLKLFVRMRDAIEYELLVRCLIGICGLQIDWEILDEGHTFELLVEGEVHPEDICLAAGKLFNFDELLSLTPVWHGDMLGVMQLVILTYVQQKLSKRIKE
jgi:uridine kinase